MRHGVKRRGIKRGRDEGVISATFFKLDHLVTMLLAEIVELPPSFTSGHTHIPLEMSQTSDPSDERSKLSSGGDEDDDDGLDKDLWVVVEKGSICSTADCVYRDPVSRDQKAGGAHAHAQAAVVSVELCSSTPGET